MPKQKVKPGHQNRHQGKLRRSIICPCPAPERWTQIHVCAKLLQMRPWNTDCKQNQTCPLLLSEPEFTKVNATYPVWNEGSPDFLHCAKWSSSTKYLLTVVMLILQVSNKIHNFMGPWIIEMYWRNRIQNDWSNPCCRRSPKWRCLGSSKRILDSGASLLLWFLGRLSSWIDGKKDAFFLNEHTHTHVSLLWKRREEWKTCLEGKKTSVWI